MDNDKNALTDMKALSKNKMRKSDIHNLSAVQECASEDRTSFLQHNHSLSHQASAYLVSRQAHINPSKNLTCSQIDDWLDSSIEVIESLSSSLDLECSKYFKYQNHSTICSTYDLYCYDWNAASYYDDIQESDACNVTTRNEWDDDFSVDDLWKPAMNETPTNYQSTDNNDFRFELTEKMTMEYLLKGEL